MPAEVRPADPMTRRRDAGSTGAWRSRALLISLVVNLFLGGVMLGRAMAPPPISQSAGTWRMGAGMAERARTLPPVDRLKFAGAFARRRDEIRASRAELRQKSELARQAMTAAPYDRAKAEAAFAEVRSASMRLQAVLQAGLADGLADLSPAARAQLAAPPERR